MNKHGCKFKSIEGGIYHNFLRYITYPNLFITYPNFFVVAVSRHRLYHTSVKPLAPLLDVPAERSAGGEEATAYWALAIFPQLLWMTVAYVLVYGCSRHAYSLFAMRALRNERTRLWFSSNLHCSTSIALLVDGY